MQKARKLANKRASQFRRERGAQPVAPAQWRRKRKGEKGDEYGYVEAARGYDDIRKVADDKDELTGVPRDRVLRDGDRVFVSWDDAVLCSVLAFAAVRKLQLLRTDPCGQVGELDDSFECFEATLVLKDHGRAKDEQQEHV